ncbi:hypothetical protein DN069_30845 [Streptacidiphilus pinicola]|uniref:Uncharacterized protein n=1 Tax=Streptacidiphilus pinicola TaxID=2219663 RepID=A0A2X0JXX8_9ACTN|nr:hypothetical protein [Streptacidiphilus pinicola]RAG81855.1 hypothetical protein DN069_30845 [Streptacidiphilus pinicola]
MNLRTVTRGDAALAASALLLLVSSFFTFYQAGVDACTGTASACSTNAWNSALFPLLPGVVLLGVIGPVLVLLGRLLPQEPSALGIGLRPWGVVLTVAAAWSALWALFGGPTGELFGHPEVSSSPQLGAFLAFLFCAADVVLAVAGPVLPVLAAPLLPEAKAQTPPSPYAPQGGEGHPGVAGFDAAGGPQQPHVGHFNPQPVQQGHPGEPFHGPEKQGATLPLPTPGEQAAAGGSDSSDAATARLSQPMPKDGPPGAASTVRLGTGPAPAAQPSAQPAAEPAEAAPAFAPFWFAVPAARPLAPENDPTGAPVGELVPGTWYLAIAQRGEALLARTQEGKSGLLIDTTGIQRG